MTNKSALPLPLVISLLLLSGCSSGQHKEDAAPTQQFDTGAPPGPAQRFGNPETPAPTQQFGTTASPVRQMQPLQPGQPPQQPGRSISTAPAIVGGQPGTTPLPFNQPFRLADEEYQFMAAKGKDHVGLDANPAMRPNQGNSYFLLRYQAINHGGSPVVVPNTAAVHLITLSNNQITDIDQAATNANVQSGAATGLPDQLTLEPERPQIQTLVFQVPNTTNTGDLAVLVTEPKDPSHVFQIVKLAN